MKIILLVSIMLLVLVAPLMLGKGNAQQSIKPFEQRLSEQLFRNDTDVKNSSNTSDLITNSSYLDMPRNTTLSQIQANNNSINQLYNNSVQNMDLGSQQTRQDINELLSILK